MNTSAAYVQQQEYLNTAFDIGTRLASQAIWDGDRCNWVGDALEFRKSGIEIIKKSCQIDVYNGTAGIALFLDKLHELTGDDIILETLEGTIKQIISVLHQDRPFTNYGFYEGGIGVACTLIQLGKSLGRQDCTDRGLDLIKEIASREIQEYEVDIMNGISGCICGLAPLIQTTQSPVLLQILNKCGTYLLDKAVKSETYWSWSSLKDQVGLTGYSHGAAGIAQALLELYAITNNPAYLEAANMGFNYERAYFNPQVGNWQDLRNFNTGNQTGATPVYGESWCHGAPGIALSRLKAWQLTGNHNYRAEAEIALNTTYHKTMGQLNQQQYPVNFSLCHGLAGNADILLTGGTILNSPHLLQAAQSIGGWGIERFRNTNSAWPSGIIDISGKYKEKTIAPGLMQGIAGTGYFYLRLFDATKTSNILMPGMHL